MVVEHQIALLFRKHTPGWDVQYFTPQRSTNGLIKVICEHKKIILRLEKSSTSPSNVTNALYQEQLKLSQSQISRADAHQVQVIYLQHRPKRV